MTAQLRGAEAGLGHALKQNGDALSSAPSADQKAENGDGEKLVLKNRAGESKSPYVRAHRDNPVAWQVWGDEAIELARRENRLIFVSIGYSACHCEFAQSVCCGEYKY